MVVARRPIADNRSNRLNAAPRWTDGESLPLENSPFLQLELAVTESSQPIVVEQAFNASKETLWKALTQRDQM